jgi:hypothetical protein
MTIKMKVGYNRFATHVNRYFQEAIEVILVFAMLVFGTITLLPYEWLPPVANPVYVSNIAKIPFGVLLLVPSLMILWTRLKYSIQDYVFVFKKRRHTALFYMSLGWVYLGVLRALQTYWPPFYMLYFALAIITYLCSLRLSK